ncbi:16S rRNA (guanine(966)-N(2))-methyltransferase RsmD [Propionivibrio limicola]|uniref:16S rRNA (guanine(966)-N(2))-methyltransferase RsmD n=1 Tax=Propionivibrio limicola TaxID=167645 RepID=UPI001290E582|nr:16S rRNA (guanine(966)-N(2))-methyltransferase RsmD [Propionivibrio limicola]
MNSVRIIGGEWKRRLLHFPDSEGLRPTPDRVRETLFNWLGQDLAGLTCLDLFAGSGALGFEAASRGAARVVMVEKSAKVRAALEENARLLGAPSAKNGRLEILGADAVKFASAFGPESPRFDVLFLDPPYKQGWIGRLEPLLPQLLSRDGVLYVEAEMELESCGDWRTVRSGRAGQVFYHLMRSGDHDGAE